MYNYVQQGEHCSVRTVSIVLTGRGKRSAMWGLFNRLKMVTKKWTMASFVGLDPKQKDLRPCIHRYCVRGLVAEQTYIQPLQWSWEAGRRQEIQLVNSAPLIKQLIVY